MGEVLKNTDIVPAGDDEKGVIGPDLIEQYGSELGAVAAKVI